MKTLAALALIALMWLVGLTAFAARVAGSTPAVEPQPAEAIVALTGASNLRLEAATRLLKNNAGKRLLISGVNRQARRSEVREVARGVGRTWDCCVDLGYEAEDTRGNASEAAKWVRKHDYHTLIVVTADYHMPRSILELHSHMPDVELIPYPVATDTVNARRWWTRGDDARRMVVEYCKYLAILGRELVRGLGGHTASSHPPHPAPESPSN
jgi:uncharacterized SAM-binding protein YcdF (DUF218 family)